MLSRVLILINFEADHRQQKTFSFFEKLEMMWIVITITIAYLIFLISVTITMILENKAPSTTLTWLMFILFVPLIGLVFYFFFGKNYRKNKMFKIKKSKDHDIYEKHANHIFHNLDKLKLFELAPVQKKERLIKLLLNNSKANLSGGNQVEVLNDGSATFDSIFAALETAQDYIHIQYYKIEEGVLLNKFIKVLSEKAKAGLKIRIIYDAVGSWKLSKGFVEEVKMMGIQIVPFMPVHLGKYANKVNFRNHRKIIIVDGKIAFTGGLNVTDNYLEKENSENYWRDTHLRIVGNAVYNLCMVFLTDWYFVSGEYLFEKENFEHIEKEEGVPVQIVTSGPDSDYSSIQQEYFSLISNAEKYVYIWTPYFVPGEKIMFALKIAALSGVDVRIILPEDSDSSILKWSTRAYVEELLKSGVKIYFYKKGFMHSKVLVSDDLVASIGTANVDERSFDNNFEVNALIYDEAICKELKLQFAIDQSDSEPVLYGAFKMRPKQERLKESTAKLLSPLL